MAASDDLSGDASQGNAAYRQLLNDIRLGVLTAGDRLRETDLADRLGVSRTPIREAIRQLEADGLVTHLPRQGATIRRLDYTEVMELYEMRAVLEGTTARLAARMASDLEIEGLEALNAEQAEAGSTGKAFNLNRQFHAAMLDAAKNRFLKRSIVGMQKALMIVGPTTLSDPDRAVRAVEEHGRVLEAIRARDGNRAEAAMRDHIEAAQRMRVRSLRDKQEPFETGTDL